MLTAYDCECKVSDSYTKAFSVGGETARPETHVNINDNGIRLDGCGGYFCERLIDMIIEDEKTQDFGNQDNNLI